MTTWGLVAGLRGSPAIETLYCLGASWPVTENAPGHPGHPSSIQHNAVNNICKNIVLYVVFKLLKFWLCIIVSLGDEIPKVVVPDIGVLEHDDDVTLVCNLTERGNKATTPLKRISWFKDGVLLETIRNPDPQNSKDMLGPLEINSVSVRDGGNYTCLLEVLLRKFKEYNVSDSTVIHSKYISILQCTCSPQRIDKTKRK